VAAAGAVDRDGGALLALGAIARLATLDDAEASTALLSQLDTWACAVGILLILADLVLPVPQASVITGLGAVYGIALGTLIGTVGPPWPVWLGTC
jgi:hypothetical protein